MWRSFFFAVGLILIFIGLQSLAVEEFRVDKNNRLFAFANRANRAIEASKSQDNLGRQNGVGFSNGPGSNFASQQQFSLPSSESYYGGPSRFQTSSYQSAYGGPQQSLAVNPVSNTANFGQLGTGTNPARLRPRALKSYPGHGLDALGFPSRRNNYFAVHQFDRSLSSFE